MTVSKGTKKTAALKAKLRTVTAKYHVLAQRNSSLEASIARLEADASLHKSEMDDLMNKYNVQKTLIANLEEDANHNRSRIVDERLEFVRDILRFHKKLARTQWQLKKERELRLKAEARLA